MQDRGAGAALTDDDDRRDHVDGGDLRMRGPPCGDGEPVLEVVRQLARDDRLPDLVEAGLRVERVGEPVETLPPGVVAEVVVPGLVPRLLHQLVHVHGRQRTAYPARP